MADPESAKALMRSAGQTAEVLVQWSSDQASRLRSSFVGRLRDLSPKAPPK